MKMTNSLTARFAGRPLAIVPTAVEQLLAASLEMPAALASLRGSQTDAIRYAILPGGIAVVPIIGPLLSRGDWLTELIGIASYADVTDAILAAFDDPSVHAMLLEVDSPGGEVGGLFDLVDQIASARDVYNKPLWAVASECALSAAYAIASTADRIYITQTGEAGSIGVLAAHVDESAADAMAGQKWTLIQSGAKKTAGNPHQPLSSQTFADIQSDVDALYDQFVTLVASNRGIPADAVRATEAAIYRGQRAVDAGLADRVGTLATALADLGFELDKTRTAAARTSRVLSSHPRSPAMITEELPADTPQIPPVVAPVAVPATIAPPAVAAPVVPAVAADALRAEYSEIAAVAAQAGRLGVTIDAADAMLKGIKPDALRRSVLDALAQRSEATAIVAATPQPSSGMSPIVQRARERAAAGKS